MITSKLRKNSPGIDGTYKNAEHHAKHLIPIIDAIINSISITKFKEWQQGSNVHVFICDDGRKFTLRNIYKDGNSIGIKLSYKASRSLELPLISISSVHEVPGLIKTMSLIAESDFSNWLYEPLNVKSIN